MKFLVTLLTIVFLIGCNKDLTPDLREANVKIDELTMEINELKKKPNPNDELESLRKQVVDLKAKANEPTPELENLRTKVKDLETKNDNLAAAGRKVVNQMTDIAYARAENEIRLVGAADKLARIRVLLTSYVATNKAPNENQLIDILDQWGFGGEYKPGDFPSPQQFRSNDLKLTSAQADKIIRGFLVDGIVALRIYGYKIDPKDPDTYKNVFQFLK